MTGRADDSRRADASADGAIEAVLLDIDGTLLDSNDAHAQAWSDALREAGHEIGSEAVRPLIGMGSDKLLPKLTGIDAESERGKRLVERTKEIFAKEYLPLVQPFPRARELDASVLSNDRFKDRIASFPEVRNRIIRYMIVAGEVVLERRTKRRGR